MTEQLDLRTRSQSEQALDLRTRCDASQSEQALVSIRKGSKTLMFCKHHYERYAVTLEECGWTVQQDNRSTLTDKGQDHDAEYATVGRTDQASASD